MPESNQTEKATPHRRTKAREQGQVVRSREFGSVLALVSAILVLGAQAKLMALHWTGLYLGLLSAAATEDISPKGPVLFWTAVEVLRWTAPALMVALVVSTSVTVAQGGWVMAPTSLAPKFDRLNPSNKLGQMVSLTALGGLVRSTIPALIIAALAGSVLISHWGDLAQSSGADIVSVIHLVETIVRTILWKAVLVLLVSAILDYLLVWRQYESKMRMSHEEIKREHKEHDGNPVIKLQVRKRQRAMRNRKPLDGAATATMVVTNPTHFAVALRYEPSMAAPEVVAKGRDLLAQKIKAIASENNVPMIENRPLARALYKNVEVGESIPAELYQAVAEILVAVFRAQDEVRRQEEQRRRRNAPEEDTKADEQ